MGFKLVFKRPQFTKTEFILPEDTVICGPFQAKGSGQINGRLKGEVNVGDKLVIGKNAEIKGDVHAAMLEVRGKVFGNIFCSDKLVIHNTAFVEGNITATVFEIMEGASIAGLIIKTTDHAANGKPEDNVENNPENSALNSPKDIILPSAEEKQPAAEPVPEKSTDHDKEATSWF